ncbi:MAG: hypothetical protein OXC46_01210 [Thaumarchaeota archaeon]|nr:hypothetical protein [Nitrososphaerota archaeon]
MTEISTLKGIFPNSTVLMVEDYFDVSMSQNVFSLSQIQLASDKGFEVIGMITEQCDSHLTIRFKYTVEKPIDDYTEKLGVIFNGAASVVKYDTHYRVSWKQSDTIGLEELQYLINYGFRILAMEVYGDPRMIDVFVEKSDRCKAYYERVLEGLS